MIVGAAAWKTSGIGLYRFFHCGMFLSNRKHEGMQQQFIAFPEIFNCKSNRSSPLGDWWR
jgi:hypothetical protein